MSLYYWSKYNSTLAYNPSASPIDTKYGSSNTNIYNLIKSLSDFSGMIDGHASNVWLYSDVQASASGVNVINDTGINLSYPLNSLLGSSSSYLGYFYWGSYTYQVSISLSGSSYQVILSKVTSASYYTRGSFIQTITADINAYTNNARNSDGYWYVRGVVANTNPSAQTIPTQSSQLNQNKTLDVAPYFTDTDGDALTFTASSSNTAIVTVSVNGSTLTLRPVALGSTIITVIANDGKGGTTSTTFTFSVVNSAPLVTVTRPSNNVTLYEGDTMTIAGTADDTNNGDVVTIRYQVNALTPVAILPFVADGAAKPFSRELTFRGGKLYDGTTLIAENLADGVPHTLKVFAGDDKGGQSPIVERTFYVVPNRTPLLTVEPPAINGVIDSDEIEFTGEFSDPDNNEATVSYRINGGNSVQVAQGTSGLFDFKVRFGQLQVGLNSIVIEVVDSYGAKVSRTIKLQKDEVAVAQLKSTARYKIKPPLGTATGVVLWVQRDEGLSLDAKISMTQVGEAEHFVAMTKSNTAPMANQPGVVEDQFQYENATAANNIILQLDMEKSSVAADEKIHLITGVVD